jgi:hypothetical protein
VTGHHPCAFTGIKSQGTRASLDDLTVDMSVQGDIGSILHPLKLQRVVNDQDIAICPHKAQGRFYERHAETLGDRDESRNLVVVSEYAGQRHVQPREHFKRLGLRDIAGVDDVFDAGSVEQLNDSADIPEVVVRVANDADAHDSLFQ